MLLSHLFLPIGADLATNKEASEIVGKTVLECFYCFIVVWFYCPCQSYHLTATLLFLCALVLIKRFRSLLLLQHHANCVQHVGWQAGILLPLVGQPYTGQPGQFKTSPSGWPHRLMLQALFNSTLCTATTAWHEDKTQTLVKGDHHSNADNVL